MNTIISRRDISMPPSDFELAIRSLHDVPISLLKSEIARRADNDDANLSDESTCGSRESGYYNTSLHIVALFLILVLSTLACSFPILARRFPRLPIPRHFLFISRHFGTGVLIATAFVHLLPTAFNSLTNPCLPSFWNKGYPAMAGFVSMISVFAVVTVEMVFATRGAKHLHGKEYDDLIREIGSGSMNGYTDDMSEYVRLTARDGDMAQDNDTAQHHEVRNDDPRDTNLDGLDVSAADPVHRAGSRSAEGSNNGNGDDDDLDLEELDPYTDEESYPQDHQKRRQVSLTQGHRHLSVHRQQHRNDGTVLQNPQRQLLQCLLLEAGILFHSIFIGMALSVATGTSFIVLLIAISFHQTFEGFALGSRIASLIPDLFSPSSPKPWLMACAYGTTTPIGQAIGLVLHNLYDPASTMGLLMVGFTNAVSSGLLIFAGLVELLAEDFLSDSSYETLRGKRRVEACIAVASGAMLMALVGAWA